jgi:hypothetical protein
VIENEEKLNHLAEEMMASGLFFELRWGDDGEIVVNFSGAGMPGMEEKIKSDAELMTLAKDVLSESFVESIYQGLANYDVMIGLAKPDSQEWTEARILIYKKHESNWDTLIVGHWYYYESKPD